MATGQVISRTGCPHGLLPDRRAIGAARGLRCTEFMPRHQPFTDDVEVYSFCLRRAERRSRRWAAGAAGMNSAGGRGLGMICLQHPDTFLGRCWYIL